MEHKRIYFFTGPPKYPTTRFRSQQYLRYFQKYGYDTIFNTSLPSSLEKPLSSSRLSILSFNSARYFAELKNVFHRWKQIAQIDNPNSIIYVHSFLTPFLKTDYLGELARKKSVRMVLDMDDAIFSTNKRTETKVKRLLSLCDASIVGNEYLADFARKHQQNVHVIPTPIDTNSYVPKAEKKTGCKDCITIGWMGAWVNLIHLDLISPSLRALKSELPNVRITIISNIEKLPSNLDDIAELKQWSAKHELEDLQSFDIGLMPLKDTSFSRGKCSFKLLQYMAVGIPVLASPVGMNNEVVKDNGFLCNSSDEWLDSLLLLCKDEIQRNKMGKRSREIVEAEYSTEFNFTKLHKAITGNDLS